MHSASLREFEAPSMAVELLCSAPILLRDWWNLFPFLIILASNIYELNNLRVNYIIQETNIGKAGEITARLAPVSEKAEELHHPLYNTSKL